MKRIIYIFILISFMPSNSWGQDSQYVKGVNYEGYIFPKDFFVFKTVENQQDRYSPTMEDISVAETILMDSIDYITRREQPYRYSHKPEINRKTLKKYKRQYVGFLTKNNEVIIWINLLRDNDISKERLSSDIIAVLDGGAYYWNIYVNITTKKVSYMYVNGVS